MSQICNYNKRLVIKRSEKKEKPRKSLSESQLKHEHLIFSDPQISSMIDCLAVSFWHEMLINIRQSTKGGM